MRRKSKRDGGYTVRCVRAAGDVSMTFVSMFGQGDREKPPPMKGSTELQQVCDLEPDYGRMCKQEREDCHVPVSK